MAAVLAGGDGAVLSHRTPAHARGRARGGAAPHEPDFTWPRHHLIVELDGYETHGTREAFERGRARDRALQSAGWRVLRITWRQLHANPATIAAELRALLSP
jgi:very-short-patch-repair endonuclease